MNPFTTHSLFSDPSGFPDPSGPGHGFRSVLLVTERRDLIRQVETSAASLGMPAPQATESARASGRWSRADLVLIGADQAATIADLHLPRREAVHLLGSEADADTMVRHSPALQAAMLVLPRDGASLSGLMLPQTSAGRAVPLLLVAHGGGAPGASTLASGLAGAAAGAGAKVLLIDADPYGGGLDLQWGLESTPGWRWPDLAAARGRLGELAGKLPHLAGVDLLAMGRLDARMPQADAVEAVLDATGEHDVIIVDAPPSLGEVGQLAAERAAASVVVAPAHVTGLAGARLMVQRMADFGTRACLVLRQEGGGGRRRLRRAGRRDVSAGDSALPTDVVAQTVGAPVIGTIPTDPRLPHAAAHGEPPWGRAGRPWRTACESLLSDLFPTTLAEEVAA